MASFKAKGETIGRVIEQEALSASYCQRRLRRTAARAESTRPFSEISVAVISLREDSAGVIRCTGESTGDVLPEEV